jgi:hypothetical protein
MIWAQLDRYVAIAQVVSGANQIELTAVYRTGCDFQHLLARGLHGYERAVLTHEHIAAAHCRTPRQENANVHLR